MSAPSVLAFYYYSGPGDVLVHNVSVPSDLCTECTYYCCLNWNMGQTGGGYCGIQCHPEGNCFIFSIWDPPKNSTTESIKPLFVSEGNSNTKRFGGEGEGLRYMNFEYNWKPDQLYTFVVRRWDQQNHTYFGLWVHDVSAGKWERMVTMDFPLPEIYFVPPIACFVEDWIGSGENARGAKYSNAFRRRKDGDWECLNKAYCYVNKGRANNKWRESYRIEALKSGQLFMQSGGKTTPSSAETHVNVTLETALEKPEIPPASFELVKCTTTTVEWRLSETSTPQFAYTVTINGTKTLTDIDPECRQASLECSKEDVVEVTIQDIIGREIKLRS